ncbi:hypothetical protein BC827DRAFT_679222 [Russula dissimulans]|nr:hypothetical protein BC827DRAFT_679222 [Russula dissimulans]
MICQHHRRRQRAPFLTRGILTLPPLSAPLHITPVPPFPPFFLFQSRTLNFLPRPTLTDSLSTAIAPQSPSSLDQGQRSIQCHRSPLSRHSPAVCSRSQRSSTHQRLCYPSTSTIRSSATHRPPRTLSFLASCLQSVFTTVPCVLLSVFLLSFRLDFPVHFEYFFFLGIAVSDAMQFHQTTSGLSSTYPPPSATQYPTRSHHCAPRD